MGMVDYMEGDVNNPNANQMQLLQNQGMAPGIPIPFSQLPSQNSGNDQMLINTQI